MSELSMRLRGFAYDLHVVADGVEALEAKVERLTAAAQPLLALHLRAYDDDVAEPVMWDSAIARLRATLEEA